MWQYWNNSLILSLTLTCIAHIHANGLFSVCVRITTIQMRFIVITNNSIFWRTFKLIIEFRCSGSVADGIGVTSKPQISYILYIVSIRCQCGDTHLVNCMWQNIQSDANLQYLHVTVICVPQTVKER